MKKLIWILPFALLTSFGLNNTVLTKKERKFAKEHLKESRKDLLKTVEGLSQAQVTFKPAADRWSVEECVKHIAASEMGLWKMTTDGLSQPPNPEKRSELKFTDEQLIQGFQDRSKKFQTSEQLQPQNIPFKTLQEALTSFKDSRGKLIQYVDDTQEDLRNHVLNMPMGVMDAYQMILLISAHTNRHTQQIKEVMADPNFPKQ